MIPKSIQFENELKNKIDKNLPAFSSADLNTFKETGFYWCNATCSNLPVSGFTVYLTVLSINTYVLQHATRVEGNKMISYERQYYSGSWTNWIPIMAQYSVAINTDFNSLRENGIYWFNGSVPTGNNRPSAVTGFLEVFTLGLLTTQRYTNYSGEKIYQRGYYNGNWSNWKEITLT